MKNKKLSKFEQMSDGLNSHKYTEDKITKSWVNDYKRKSAVLSYGEFLSLDARARKLILQPGLVSLNNKIYVYTPMRWYGFVLVLPALWIKVRMNQILKEFRDFYEIENRKIDIGHTFFEPKGGVDPLAPISDNPFSDMLDNIKAEAKVREQATVARLVRNAFLKVVGGGVPVSFPKKANDEVSRALDVRNGRLHSVDFEGSEEE